MADVLFLAVNKGSIDNGVYSWGGDPIQANPGNHSWGEEEDKRLWIAKYGGDSRWPGKLFILRINGLTVNRAREFIVPHIRPATVIDPEFNSPDDADKFVTVKLCCWNLDVEGLPSEIRNSINDVGYAEMELKDVTPFFRNKSTGECICA